MENIPWTGLKKKIRREYPRYCRGFRPGKFLVVATVVQSLAPSLDLFLPVASD
ncbi:MAG: hypothetical protein PHN60_02795 [Candidatus Gracilibacteria bacterium]|nr:hypothetical protein [Candidatus Gracilibacteria bacterium]